MYRSMSVSSCRCCMFVSCVHPVAVLNDEFWSRMQEETPETLVGSHECVLLFSPCCCGEFFYYL